MMSEEIQQLQAEIVDLKDELFDEQFKLAELEDVCIPHIRKKLVELRDETLPYWSTREAQMAVNDILLEIDQWRT